MSVAEKNAALGRISAGRGFASAGKAKVRIGTKTVHVRFCSTNRKAPSKYKFNINPNTLSADYELWVCGSASDYYLMPIELMEQIYNDPNTYVDRAHPEIRVVSIDSDTHTVTYASGGKSTSVAPYLGRTLP